MINSKIENMRNILLIDKIMARNYQEKSKSDDLPERL